MVSLSSTTAMPMARQALTIFTNPFRKYTIPTILFTHKSPKRHRFSCHYTAISDPKPCIRSPEAIALEYSDLNLPHTTSEVILYKLFQFFLNLMHLYISMLMLILLVLVSWLIILKPFKSQEILDFLVYITMWVLSCIVNNTN